MKYFKENEKWKSSENLALLPSGGATETEKLRRLLFHFLRDHLKRMNEFSDTEVLSQARPNFFQKMKNIQ